VNTVYFGDTSEILRGYFGYSPTNTRGQKQQKRTKTAETTGRILKIKKTQNP